MILSDQTHSSRCTLWATFCHASGANPFRITKSMTGLLELPASPRPKIKTNPAKSPIKQDPALTLVSYEAALS